MKTVNAVVVVASALAMLLLTPLQIAASAHGFHAFHWSAHFHGGHHHRVHGAYGAYGAWPFYGDVVPPYTADVGMSYTPPAQIVYGPEWPQVLGCHHSEQTVTVPAEAGGTRQVTITRC
jgi:hypothetical protein